MIHIFTYIVDFFFYLESESKKIRGQVCDYIHLSTVEPVCNDHLYDKIYYLWFIQ